MKKDRIADYDEIRAHLKRESLLGDTCVKNTVRFIEEEKIPFSNSGFLDPTSILNIMAITCRKRLEVFLGSGREKLSEDDLRKEYEDSTRNDYFGLSDEMKLRIYCFEKEMGELYGPVSSLVWLGCFDISMGSLAKNEAEPCIRGKSGNMGVTVNKTYLEFLGFSSEKELERVIRTLLIKKSGRELTRLNPMYEDRFIYAVRPPKDGWGCVLKRSF